MGNQKIDKPLSAKVERFCQEYVVDMNGTQAAIRAGYSEKSAATQAVKMLKREQVKARIAELQAELSEKTGVNAEWVLMRMQLVAERCMQAEPVMEKVDGQLVPTGEYRFDAAGANTALANIGKHLGMFVDKKEVSVNGRIEITRLPPKEKA